MTDITFLSGPPASTKSTILKDFEYDEVLSFDTIRDNIKSYDVKELNKLSDNEVYIENLPKEKVYKVAQILFKKYLLENKKIVFDATFQFISQVQPYLDIAKELNKTTKLVVINIKKDDALINSIERMYQKSGKVYFHQSEVPDELKTSNFYTIIPIFKFYKQETKSDRITLTKRNPELFDEVQTIKFRRKNLYPEYKNKALFVDLDSTIRETKSGKIFPTEVGDVKIMDNVIPKLQEYKDKGYKIIAVTNQSGVNKGDLSEETMHEIVKETNELTGNLIDDYKACTHSPMAYCCCRKPQSGIGIHFKHKYQLDLSQCIMVGDRTTDITFGNRLGMKTFKAVVFFKK